MFEINAVNDYGFDQDETIIIYKRRITGSPPVVDITHPFNPITETQLQIQNITSFALNVSQNQIFNFSSMEMLQHSFYSILLQKFYLADVSFDKE